MILIGLYIAFVLGALLGAFFHAEEDCPRAVMGYHCDGPTCDHTKSELYRAKMQMALADEDFKANRDNNFWGGGV